MDLQAAPYSGYLRRSLAALQARADRDPAPLTWLSRAVEAPLDAAVIDDLWAQLQPAPPADADRVGEALRKLRLLLMLALIERDVGGRASLDEVVSAMTRLAELACTQAAHAAADELVARYGRPAGPDGRLQDLLIVGMGKAGGRELNVSSDLDLVFVHREEGETTGRIEDGEVLAASRIATSDFMHRLARRISGILSEHTGDGFVFRIDTRLRPNGDSGPLVVSQPMLEQYFFAQGREWERFAWLKGRVLADSGMAGEARRIEDETAMHDIVRPFVYRRYLDFRAFAAMRELHAMIRAEVARRDARFTGSYDVKLGRGGIREIEFVAQLFQIVRGGRDPGLRDRRTLVTLEGLAQRGILPRADTRVLSEAYVLLRRTEHALQYREDAQTHRLQADAGERDIIARMLGMDAGQFERTLAAATDGVQRIFDGVLHSHQPPAPPSGPMASMPPLSSEVAPAGLSDPAPGPAGAAAPVAAAANGDPIAGQPGANGTPTGPSPISADLQRRIEALRSGARYRSARDETRRALERLLELALAASTPEPGVIRLIEMLETVLGRPAYLALLAQYPQAFARVLRMLSQAQWAAEYLTRHPIVLDELLDGQMLQPTDYRAWMLHVEDTLSHATIGDAPDVERQMDIVREAHHAQVFRLLAQDLEGLHTVERLSDHLSELADRVLEIALRLCWSQLRSRFRDVPRFAVIAFGKLGGKELGYASDLDLVFIHQDPDERAPEAYAQLAQRLAGWLSTRTAAGLLFEIDLRLRPNGNAGLMVSSLESFAEYERTSAWVWEHQALTRARFAVGDVQIGAAFERERRTILSQPRDAAALRDEVVKMRRKMHDGHPNRSTRFDLKHDDGGMVDIEFIVQYLVLAHAHDVPALLDNVGNIALLGRAADVGLIERSEAVTVADAYRRYRQLQHTLRLNDVQYARVEPDTVAAERRAVSALWRKLLG